TAHKRKRFFITMALTSQNRLCNAERHKLFRGVGTIVKVRRHVLKSEPKQSSALSLWRMMEDGNRSWALWTA
ncbi:hypothetical protein, partial [Pseudomonas syringae group genomosp. 3]|uniref:hypothetical protein n=1 Tax=Pseudomonas syringae group genomosp. 3 TaxID=251701 RepID=UPI001E2E06D0